MVDPIKIEDARTRLIELIVAGELDAAAAYLRDMHPADSAEILEALDPAIQAEIVARLQPGELADVFGQMDGEDAAEVALQHLDVDEIADVLDEMDPDEAADLLNELEPADATAVLEQMDEAHAVSPLLAYAEDSAGGIMNVAPPSLRRQMTVSDAFRFIREHYHDANEAFYLYVLDRNGRLIGVINLRALILAEAHQTVEEIMDRNVYTIRVDMDQEAVAQLLARYDLLALPVVDFDNRLVGIITVDDIVDVIEEEATEDIYRLAQVSSDSDIFSPTPVSVRNRLPWLFINLATAIVASAVVAFFQGSIAQLAILAVFMPLVAGMGGNAGNQSMTVVVRSLALGEIDVFSAWPVLKHEILIGLVNGLALGLTVGLIGWLWQDNPMLGVVVGLAMLANLIVAAVAGALVPMGLKKVGVDPALASSVFVTTATDCMGFAVFLGLATYFMAWLT
jgi:magnesium transporter